MPQVLLVVAVSCTVSAWKWNGQIHPTPHHHMENPGDIPELEKLAVKYFQQYILAIVHL